MVVVNPEITARTKRLLLRPLTLEDAADVNIMRAHPEVMKHTYGPQLTLPVHITDSEKPYTTM